MQIELSMIPDELCSALSVSASILPPEDIKAAIDSLSQRNIQQVKLATSVAISFVLQDC